MPYLVALADAGAKYMSRMRFGFLIMLGLKMIDAEDFVSVSTKVSTIGSHDCLYTAPHPLGS